jgi:pilus assembly protein CpaF
VARIGVHPASSGPTGGNRVEAVRTVEDEVRELIRRTGLDPARDTAAVTRLVRDAVNDYDDRSIHGSMPALGDLDHAVKAVLDSVAGFGPLQRYFDDPESHPAL